MQKVKPSSRIISVVVTLILLTSPILAQKRGAAPRKPAPVPEVAPTFDTLLAEETYRIYSEMRNVGQVVRSPAANDLLQPLMKIAGVPKEFKTIIKWIDAHGEALATSRMFVASWPVKPALPQMLMAVEFSTPEEAKKFESELRGFVPTLMATPTPSPAASPGSAAPKLQISTTARVELAPLAPSYQIKQTGSLVLLSDKPISFQTLKPRRSRLLAEDPNFALARNRFASEAIFLYVDVKSIEKEQREQTRKWQEEEEKRREKEAADPPKPDVAGDEDSIAAMPPPPPEELAAVNVSPEPTGSPNPPVSVEADQGKVTATLSSGPQSDVSWSMISLFGALLGGAPKWPEAVGAAVAFEDDGYAMRALIINGPDNKSNAIPFVPQFISGPALTPASPAIMPADVDLFVALSLDYPQIYDGMLKAISGAEEASRKLSRQTVADKPPTSPFAEYEKKLGLKIKDDLLPLLGNEIALVLPKKPTKTNQPATRPEQPADENNEKKPVSAPGFTPVIAIAIKDREAVKQLIPKIIDGFAFKGASLLAQTEKRDDTEITSFAGVLSYGFIGDFMIISPDSTLVRHVVDSYLNHQTLSSDGHFRNSTRWQPRQVQGQVYVAPSLIDLYYPLGPGPSTAVNDQLRELLGGMNPIIEPLTYALTNEGSGPLHELHMPKGLLMVMIAGMSAQSSESPIITNESIAQSMLRTVSSAQASFRADKGDGRYGTLDELVSEGLISKDLIEKYGYKIELSVLTNKFEATATPLEYGKTGRRSFFVDESGVLRAGDHGGGAATVSDKPVE